MKTRSRVLLTHGGGWRACLHRGREAEEPIVARILKNIEVCAECTGKDSLCGNAEVAALDRSVSFVSSETSVDMVLPNVKGDVLCQSKKRPSLASSRTPVYAETE